jgi:hypothetical protein
MTVHTQTAAHRYFPPDYSSDGVSEESQRTAKVRGELPNSSAVSVTDVHVQLFQKVVNARAEAEHDDWDGEGAAAVSVAAVAHAIQLSQALATALPIPDVSPEPTAGISFEWYKDPRHVAVLTVDGEFIRWAALIGDNAPISGREPFTKTIPNEALQAVRAVLE